MSELTASLDSLGRAALAHHVYNTVLHHSETFYGEDCVGGDLAYLMGAILDPTGNGWVDWSDLSVGVAPPALLKILREQFASDCPVWHFVRL
jgi:hypothetical protein